MPQRSPGNPDERFATLVSVLLVLIVVAVLYVAREIFVPLALALLFSFLLAPLVTRLEKWRLGRIPATLLTVLFALGVLGGVGYLVGGQLMDLTYQLPGYKKTLVKRIQTLKASGGNTPLTEATKTLKDIGEQLEGSTPKADATRPNGPTSTGKDRVMPVEIVQPATSISALAQSVAGPVLGPLATAAIVLVFVLFMLIKREDLRDRIIHLIGRGKLSTTTQALDEAAAKVSGFLLMQVIVNAVFGVLMAVGLFFIGVPNAFLWGLLAGVLRFIPYLGAWIALAFPLIISLAVTDTWRMPIETVAIFGGVELMSSNVLEPWLYGAHTGLSPVALMVATIFWTWLWGGVGLLLATPLTVCVAVLGKYIPSLSFLDALLGDEPTLSDSDRYFQRLLAMDDHEAGVVADTYLKDHTLPEFYSALLAPALSAAKREAQEGNLDERHQRYIYDSARDTVEELSARTASLAKTVKDKSVGAVPIGKTPAEASAVTAAVSTAALAKHPVFCLPAADEADELTAFMVAQTLAGEGYKAESLSYKTLANEMVSQVAAAGCTVVCVAATPPHDTLHTRYLCKLLRARLPDLDIIVGLWDAVETDPEKLARRTERLAATKVVTSLTDALEQIRPLAVLEG